MSLIQLFKVCSYKWHSNAANNYIMIKLAVISSYIIDTAYIEAKPYNRRTLITGKQWPAVDFSIDSSSKQFCD
jgi:hypothetical protein